MTGRQDIPRATLIDIPDKQGTYQVKEQHAEKPTEPQHTETPDIKTPPTGKKPTPQAPAKPQQKTAAVASKQKRLSPICSNNQNQNFH